MVKLNHHIPRSEIKQVAGSIVVFGVFGNRIEQIAVQTRPSVYIDKFKIIIFTYFYSSSPFAKFDGWSNRELRRHIGTEVYAMAPEGAGQKAHLGWGDLRPLMARWIKEINGNWRLHEDWDLFGIT